MKRAACFLGVFGAALMSAQASAAVILPGKSAAAVSTADPRGIANIATVDTTTAAFSNGRESGTVDTLVLTNDSANVYGLDKLTFVYLVTNDGTSLDAIERVTAADFGGMSTDVYYGAGLTGHVPTILNRSSSLGPVVGMNFDPYNSDNWLQAGEQAMLVVRTNAITYQAAVVGIIDGQTSSVSSYGPSAVPEPASLALLTLGAAALLRRR